jgi:predicted Zn finger-like uncharacterized protein
VYTQCPDCLAIYKIGAEPLARARGRVVCGSCAHEFDALESLADELPPEPIHELERRPPAAPPPLGVPAMRPRAAQRELFVDFDKALQEKREPPPSFARRRRRERATGSGPAWGWAFGVVALGLGLAAQLAYAQRDRLLVDPRVRRAVDFVCARVACSIPAVADVDRIGLLARNVRPHPSVPDALIISATLVNRAPFAQPYPVIEITLSDPNENRIAMRRFLPSEYVSDRSTVRRGLAPTATLSVNLEVADPGKNAVAFEFRFL